MAKRPTARKPVAANDYDPTDEQEDAFFPGQDDDDDFTENEDGSVTFHERKGGPADVDKHFRNLAEDMEPHELRRLATDLLQLLEYDQDANKRFDEDYAKGIRRTGISGDAPGGADHAGASKVTNPVLLECSVDFQSTIYKECFPADGPCKTKIIGKINQPEIERSSRIRDFMNWQMTTEIAECEAVLDTTWSQASLGGSQYVELFWDKNLGRPAMEFVRSDRLILPYSVSDLRSAHFSRFSIRFNLNRDEYKMKVDSGEYIDVAVSEMPLEPERSKVDEAIDKIYGREPAGWNEDGLREMHKVYVMRKFEWDDKPAPYIVVVDESEEIVMSIVRNWEEDDERRIPMAWVVEFPFIRFDGPKSVGLMQLIGGLQAGSTGALRALLDSAFISNSASAIKLRGGRMNAETVQVPIAGIAEVESAPNIDDIRKLVMPIPFNPPSTVLYQLLGYLTQSAKGLVSTAEEKLDNASSTTPVGTTMAMIEQGGKVFSSIHKRNWRAMAELMSILYRINRMYLTEERVFDEIGDKVVKPEDFQGPNTIEPVADPNIFSEGQRFAQMQGVGQLIQVFDPEGKIADRRE
jgi:hypothetical protein